MDIIPTDETFSNVKNKIFVISLPRTGTKSICTMLQILGYRTYHCPSVRLQAQLQNNDFDVFADTPVYCPSIFKKVCDDPSNKFIYIDRNVNEWIESFERMKLHDAYMDYMTRSDILYRTSRLDKLCLSEIFDNVDYRSEIAMEKFHKHKAGVLACIKHEQLLIYNFNDGWSNLCDFLGKSLPVGQTVPHINQNTLFDKVNLIV